MRRKRGVSGKRDAPAKRIQSERFRFKIERKSKTGGLRRVSKKKHPEWTSNPSRVFHFNVGVVVLQHGCGDRLDCLNEIEGVFSLGTLPVDNAIQFIFRL